ncbi:MAG: insulinase family protein [Melioribacteraceae bacterium]|nr:insulinase family protein [Melioribacteraceae bacterium]MCO6474626.1 insulinase family protein [Melioribacteraceae bacterium]MDD3557615.1 pitrilysin family protein [Melioribacteraceae bacterium]
MRKNLLSIFIFFFACGLLYGQAREIEFEEYDLDNGLHVILHEDHSTPIVAVTVFYHVGSKNEDPERTGFAHFFEHLMFEGSENIPRGEYMKIVQSNGGTLNATTDFDRTYYYQILPSNQLELGLWLESERMLHLKIDSIGVETQRKVVKEERKQRLDNQPYGSLLEETFSHAYTVHPYRWTPIGSAQYIDLATLDEFIEFYKMYYVPNNATLTIAGDFKSEQAKEMIEKYFGSIPKGSKEIYRPTSSNLVEPKKTEEVRDIVYDNIQLPLVLHAYHIPAMKDEDQYPLDMLTTLLSSGQSSRMYKQLVDKQQLALQAASFPLSLEDPGLFLTFAVANAGINAEILEDAMQAELDKVKNELIGEEEFQKLRNKIENDFVSGNSSVAGIAGSLANYYNFYKDTNLINTELEKYMKVTREDIQRVANEYLTKENRVVLYYLPKSDQPKSE